MGEEDTGYHDRQRGQGGFPARHQGVYKEDGREREGGRGVDARYPEDEKKVHQQEVLGGSSAGGLEDVRRQGSSRGVGRTLLEMQNRQGGYETPVAVMAV